MARSARAILECRILNPDSVGLVVSRLDQKHLGQLVEWFMAEEGGAAGSAILINAPLFDTMVQRCVDQAVADGDLPRAMSISLFGSGLGIGSHWLGEREAESAFPSFGTLAELVESLRSFRLPDGMYSSGSDGFNPVNLVERLCAIDMRVDVVVHAVLRIAVQILSSLSGRQCGPAKLVQSPVSRLILFAGMIAAGVVIPEVADEGLAQEVGDESARLAG